MKRFVVTLVALGAAALMLIPAGLASAKSPKAEAAAYRGAGRTSQGGGVLLRLASSGRSITETIEFRVSCDSGATYTDTVTDTGPSHVLGFVGHNPSRVKWDFTDSMSGAISGIPATLEIEMAGNVRLGSGNAKGTFQPTLTLANGDKCTSGNIPITWSAHF